MVKAWSGGLKLRLDLLVTDTVALSSSLQAVSSIIPQLELGFRYDVQHLVPLWN